MIEVTCLNCKKKFFTYPYYLKVGKKKYCSKLCSNVGMKGRHSSPKTQFKKGNESYWKGKKRPGLKHDKQFKKGIITWNKGLKGYHAGKDHHFFGVTRYELREQNNHEWKGEDAGYTSKHDWISNRLGKPNYCELCDKTTGKFQWANKDHKYRRVLSDWMRVCQSCHKKYDLKKQSLMHDSRDR